MWGELEERRWAAEPPPDKGQCPLNCVAAEAEGTALSCSRLSVDQELRHLLACLYPDLPTPF